IHLDAEIRKRDSRPQRVSVKRRSIDALGPMGFRWLNALSAAIIQCLVIKGSRLHGLIECQDGGFKFPGRQSQRYRQLLDARRGNRRKHRWHETPGDFGVDDAIRRLIRLLGNQATPDGVPFGPEILALVIEALALLVHDDAERQAIQTRHNTAVKFWS